MIHDPMHFRSGTCVLWGPLPPLIQMRVTFIVHDRKVTHYLVYDADVTYVEVSDFCVCHTLLGV